MWIHTQQRRLKLPFLMQLKRMMMRIGEPLTGELNKHSNNLVKFFTGQSWRNWQGVLMRMQLIPTWRTAHFPRL